MPETDSLTPEDGPCVLVQKGDAWEVVLVTTKDGKPAPYDGHSRKAALEAVLGRAVSAGEIVLHTRMFSPRRVVLP